MQLLNHVAEAQLTLTNTGKVRFRFHIPQPEDRCVETTWSPPAGGERAEEVEHVKPGQPVVVPTHVRPHLYLPFRLLPPCGVWWS